MSNKNENYFSIDSGLRGLLRLDIMVCKVAILTYLWSFSENLENCRKVTLW